MTASPPFYTDEAVTLHHGNSLDILPTLADASVDAVVCDPPYEIGIASRDWDRSGIAFNTEIWAQCLRVLKPGGHLLSFGAPRTYHRMAVAAEDAGFRIVDQLDWIYIHGKPKGTDLARAIDRRRDDREQVLQVTAWLAAARDAAGWTNRRIDALFGFSGMGGLWTTQGVAAIVPTAEQWRRLQEAIGFDDTEILPLVTELNARKRTVGEAWAQREVVGRRDSSYRGGGLYGEYSGDTRITAPHSEQAKQWAGWNTALKPAHDPILLARKSTGYDSLVGGLLRHGVGGLNAAGCPASGGGWPTNILLGHSPDCVDGGDCQPGCPVVEMDRQSGITPSNARTNKGGSMGYHGGTPQSKGWAGDVSGGASRFFPVFRYEAKAPASERPRLADGTAHTTVKPLALMRWLVRLVTPPGGTVLDPFAGSGTTLEACRLEGFHSVGIELDAAHAELCRVRLNKPYMASLFGDLPA